MGETIKTEKMEDLHCRECGENLDNSDTEYYEDGFMNDSDPICIECMNDVATRELFRCLKLEADVVSLSIKLKNAQALLRDIINAAQKAYLETE